MAVRVYVEGGLTSGCVVRGPAHPQSRGVKVKEAGEWTVAALGAVQ
jgi:hypothetical protein